MAMVTDVSRKTRDPSYVPGISIEKLARERGVADAIKLASNESRLGPSPRALEALASGVALHMYPDPEAFQLRSAIAARHAVALDQVALGNGTTELVSLLVRRLLKEKEETLLNAWPSFVWYRMAAALAGREELSVPLLPDLSYDLERLLETARHSPRARLLFLANPNNPTGRGVSDSDLATFLEKLPSDLFVAVDEAYAEYRSSDVESALRICLRRPRTVVLRTFSKAFGLAALRVGYAVGDREVIAELERARDPFASNAIAQVAACAALGDLAHVDRARRHNLQELPALAAGLRERAFFVWPSSANFVLATVPENLGPAAVVAEELLSRGVIVRTLPNYDLTDCLRITVGSATDHQRLLRALDEVKHRKRLDDGS